VIDCCLRHSEEDLLADPVFAASLCFAAALAPHRHPIKPEDKPNTDPKQPPYPPHYEDCALVFTLVQLSSTQDADNWRGYLFLVSEFRDIIQKLQAVGADFDAGRLQTKDLKCAGIDPLTYDQLRDKVVTHMTANAANLPKLADSLTKVRLVPAVTD
jgi:hypothetical protein